MRMFKEDDIMDRLSLDMDITDEDYKVMEEIAFSPYGLAPFNESVLLDCDDEEDRKATIKHFFVLAMYIEAIAEENYDETELLDKLGW